MNNFCKVLCSHVHQHFVVVSEIASSARQINTTTLKPSTCILKPGS